MDTTNEKQKKGFSLVELLVSMSIFTIVVTIAVGSLLVLVDANTKAQNTQSVMTNLNFAIDSMTREIRTGFGYICDGDTNAVIIGSASGVDCLDQNTGSAQISLIEGGASLTGGLGNPRIAYRFVEIANLGRIERRVSDCADCNWIPITSEEVDINVMFFVVSGTARTAAGNTEPPTVTVYIDGIAGDITGTNANFEIQTTITQQLLDV